MGELDILEMTANNYEARAIGAEDLAWELWLEMRRMSTESELREVRRRLEQALGPQGKDSLRKLEEAMQGHC